MRSRIFNIISSIKPFDNLELEHKEDALAWLKSGKEIFRIKKPDIPPKHLVSYIVLFDTEAQKILLIKHRKSGLWLPSGGHVEIDEDPQDTVKRELKEELGISARFIMDSPLFITVTQTINEAVAHTDVSLWYVLKGDLGKILNYDKREIEEYKWFSFEEVLSLELAKCDPHLHRFIQKLRMLKVS